MIEDLLKIRTSEAIRALYAQEVPASAIGLEITKKEIEGDFTIVLFPVSKISRKSPEATAQEVGNWLSDNVDGIREFKVIKGFLNLILKDEFWTDSLVRAGNEKDYGFNETTGELPVLLEYSSPNTNKPLHLGHIRNNLLGFSLSRILGANGQRVIRMNLVNDRGIHICKSMLAYMKWGNNETPETGGMKSDHLIGKYYVLFDKKFKEEVSALVASGVATEEASRTAPLILEAQEILRKWEAGDEEVRNLWSAMNGWAFKGFDETYQNLGVAFDVIQHESDTYLSGKEIVLRGLKDGILIRKPDGSIWADLTGEGLDEKLLLRADGTSVYMTQDIGTATLRFGEFHPSKMIYVVGNEQNYHFDVLTRVLKKLGYSWADNLYHLSYGMVELPEGKMKSREGNVVDADDLMVEMLRTAEETTRALGKVENFPTEEVSGLFRIIGLGALKYFILKVDPKKNMLFDPKESIDFNGNTGPFIQYTYARIKSLLRKASVNADNNSFSGYGTNLLNQEREIIKLISRFPQIVAQAGLEYNPAVVANYVYDLAKEYNQFYQEIPVLREDDEIKKSLRIKLSEVTSEIVRSAMWLLGIDVPERM